jgi:hypothetical protein
MAKTLRTSPISARGCTATKGTCRYGRSEAGLKAERAFSRGARGNDPLRYAR